MNESDTMTKNTGDRSYLIVMCGIAEYSYPLEGETELLETIHVLAKNPVEAKRKAVEVIRQKLHDDFMEKFGFVPEMEESTDKDSYRVYFKMPPGVLHREEVGIGLVMTFEYVIDITDPYNPDYIEVPPMGGD